MENETALPKRLLNWTDIAAFGIVAAIAAWLLSPLLDAGFLTDDFHIIHICTVELDLEHPLAIENFKEFFHYFVIQASPFVQLYRPTVLVSYGINLLCTGLDPYWFQLTNLALHLIAGFVVYRFIKAVLPRAKPTHLALAVLVFLTSPLALEVAAWSAARSETLSLIFGLLALTAKIRNRESVWRPLIYVVFSITSKESGLTFLCLLLAIEFEPLHGPRPERWFASLSQKTMRAVPLLILGAVYFWVRGQIFGDAFGVYSNKSSDNYLEARNVMMNVQKTLRVFVTPMSLVVKPAFLDRMWGVALCMMVWSTLAVQLFMRIPVQWWRQVLFTAAFFVLPLTMSVMVNPVNHSLVATRALYAPMAAFAVALVMGMTAARHVLRWTPIAGLVVLSLATNRACQAPHLAAAREVRGMLESIWQPIRAIEAPTFTRIAILGYEEKQFFNRSFDMAAAIRVAVKPPFLSKHYQLAKVTMTTQGEFRSFDDVLRESLHDVAFFVMVDDEVTGGRRCRLVHPGILESPKAHVELVSPPSGANIEIDLNRTDNVPPTFEFRLPDPCPEKLTLTVLTAERVLPSLEVETSKLERIADASGTLCRITVPLAAIQGVVSRREPFAWFLTLSDAQNRPVARTAPRLFHLTLMPKNG